PFSHNTPEWGFVDAWVKTSAWVPNYCTSHTSVGTDNYGWVNDLPTGQCASKHLFSGMEGHYPSGEYVILWEGDGSFSIEQDGNLLLSHTEGESTPISNGLNRATFNVATTSSNDGIYFELTSIASDYLKNIRIILPGGSCGINQTTLNHFSYCETPRGGENSCPESETCYDFESVYWDRFRDPVEEMTQPKLVFHPVFIERLKSYRAIRFMKWSSNHESLLENWNDRAQLQKDTYADDADYDDDKTKT
ncbi:MAG: hypothetical protein GY816_23395, partial [Cytophagales bacterium]|nr:hypothetical protein [Cytophagales bacterium]